MVQTVPGSVLIKAAALLLRTVSPQSQSQLPSWDRGPVVSPADMRTDAFTARPLRSQSFRDPPLKGRGQLVLRDRTPPSDHVTGLCSLSLLRCRPQPVWDRTAASRIPVVGAGGSEPRLPRPPPALRYAAALPLISSLIRPAVTPVSSSLISS